MNTSNNKRVTKHDFEMVSVLGKGAYGKVILVRKKDGKDRGQMYAMKALKKKEILALG